MGTAIPGGPFSIWELRPPAGTMIHIWHSGLATILWSLWKARNDLVFNTKASTACLVLRRAADDLMLWRWRYKTIDRGRLDTLRSLLLLSAL
jgi:hypothetical protein